jgi:hypothetical protein
MAMTRQATIAATQALGVVDIGHIRFPGSAQFLNAA